MSDEVHYQEVDADESTILPRFHPIKYNTPRLVTLSKQSKLNNYRLVNMNLF